MTLLSSAVAVAIGFSMTVGEWKQLDKFAPKDKQLYVRSLRAVGILTVIAGLLTAVDTIWFH